MHYIKQQRFNATWTTENEYNIQHRMDAIYDGGWMQFTAKNECNTQQRLNTIYNRHGIQNKKLVWVQ